MRVTLLVNPKATSYTPGARDAVAARWSVGHDVTVVETQRRDHAADLAREAAASGAELVVVLAGDGTLNETADALVGSTVALAPLPGGSTNVFARTLGLADDPLEASDQLLDALDQGRTRRVGLGRATPHGGTPRVFLFHLGMGFDAAVVREMEARPNLKRPGLAHPVFVLTAVRTWVSRYDRATGLAITTDDARFGTGPYAVVSNSDPYTYIGHRRVVMAPTADLDHALSVTLFDDLRADLVLRAAASGMRDGSLVARSPRILQRDDVHAIDVLGDRPFPWQVDGDYLGEVTALHVEHVPDALTLLLPT